MGRPLKTGLDFFGMDIDMDEDDKIIDFLENIGTNTGMGAIWQLLNAIYKQGYYIEWNNSILKKLCRKKHLDKPEMEKAIQYLTGSNMSYSERQENALFFDYELYKDYKILTSKGIQKRYLIACSRRSMITFDSRFILLDYSEQTNPHREKVGDKYEPVNRKGYWTELDSKLYLLNFITNGLICDNTNGVNDDNNSHNVNGGSAQSNKLQLSNGIVDNGTQRTIQDIDNTIQDNTIQNKDIGVFGGFKSATPERNYSSEYESLRTLWNSLSLPECRKLPDNISNWGEILNSMQLYTPEEITASINNYAELQSREKSITYSTFPNFLIKGIEKYADSSQPFNTFKETEEEKSKRVSKEIFEDLEAQEATQ